MDPKVQAGLLETLGFSFFQLSTLFKPFFLIG